MRKVKDCYGCPAHTNICCLLGFERNKTNKNVNFGGIRGCVTIYSPKICCHKPKSSKYFFKKWQEVRRMKNES